MARTFNYQRASTQDIAAHILTIQRQSYLKVLSYYVKLHDSEITSKLLAAERINYKIKLEQMLECA